MKLKEMKWDVGIQRLLWGNVGQMGKMCIYYKNESITYPGDVNIS